MKKKHVYLKGELGLSNFFTNLFRLIFIVTLTISLQLNITDLDFWFLICSFWAMMTCMDMRDPNFK